MDDLTLAYLQEVCPRGPSIGELDAASEARGLPRLGWRVAVWLELENTGRRAYRLESVRVRADAAEGRR